MRIIRFVILTLVAFNTTLCFGQDPDAPLITYLSVNPNNQQVDIFWVNSSSQVVGYVIYFQDISGLWIPLDTVQGINNTSYTTQNANPQQKIETFSVVAFDALGNSSIRSDSHSTVFMNFSFEECDTSLLLQWNSYLNMYAMNGYQLKFSRQDLTSGVQYPQEVIAINENDTSIEIPIEYSSKYSMWIETVSPLEFISKSNRLDIFTTEIDVPTYSYINRVSVVGENSIEVSVVSDSEDLSHVNIYKSNLENGFQYFFGKASLSADEFITIDPLVLPERNVYYYESKPVDICGKEYDLPQLSTASETSVAHNLKLSPLSVSGENISVQSEDYDNFISESHLELWKEVNNQHTFLQDAIPNSQYNVSISKDVGKVCLYMMSTEDNLNEINRKDTVISNKVCISKSPLLFIPKAFTPQNGDSKNDSWKIEVYGKEAIQSYSLKIFTRWGAPIFESTSFEESWDGTFNNEAVADGVYIYHLQISYAQGEKLQKSGSVLIFR